MPDLEVCCISISAEAIARNVPLLVDLSHLEDSTRLSTTVNQTMTSGSSGLEWKSMLRRKQTKKER
jgi:hypothetical protein